MTIWLPSQRQLVAELHKVKRCACYFSGGMEDISVQTNRRYLSGFIGCVTNVTLATDYKIDLMADATYGQNINRCS